MTTTLYLPQVHTFLFFFQVKIAYTAADVYTHNDSYATTHQLIVRLFWKQFFWRQISTLFIFTTSEQK